MRHRKRTSHHINRRPNTDSKEARTETSKEVSDHIIFESREFQNRLRQRQFIRGKVQWSIINQRQEWSMQHLLDLVIAGQLSSVDDTIACYVRSQAGPQSGDPFLHTDDERNTHMYVSMSVMMQFRVHSLGRQTEQAKC
jgi:hypothetical protein